MTRRRSLTRGVCSGWVLLSILLGGGVPLATGEAATLVVTSLADPGDGTACQDDPQDCTLREALAAAQAGDTITFDPVLFARGPVTIRLRSGLLRLTRNISLVGPGLRLLRISGHRTVRVLRIRRGVVASIHHVTVTQGGNSRNTGGGGIYNAGTLTLVHSTVCDNVSSIGGGIYNIGTLTLVHSTVSGNRATGNGGGLINLGTVTLEHSTVSGNSASSGGGLYTRSGGILNLIQSTVTDNAAAQGGGLAYEGYALVRLHTTIVAGNTASVGPPDCGDSDPYSFQSYGYNLLGTATGCLQNPILEDRTIDPAAVFSEVLEPLADNGGPSSPMRSAREAQPLMRATPIGVGERTSAACYGHKAPGVILAPLNWQCRSLSHRPAGQRVLGLSIDPELYLSACHLWGRTLGLETQGFARGTGTNVPARRYSCRGCGRRNQRLLAHHGV